MGFRFDDTFVNRMFFGGKTVYFQGTIFGGPGGVRIFRSGSGNRTGPQPTWKPADEYPPHQDVASGPKGILQQGVSLLAKAGKKAGQFILNKLTGNANPPAGASTRHAPRENGADISYQLHISAADAAQGANVEVELPYFEGGKRVSVHIPAGVRTGTKLRLKQMGQPLPHRPSTRGDLYLHLQVS